MLCPTCLTRRWTSSSDSVAHVLRPSGLIFCASGKVHVQPPWKVSRGGHGQNPWKCGDCWPRTSQGVWPRCIAEAESFPNTPLWLQGFAATHGPLIKKNSQAIIDALKSNKSEPDKQKIVSDKGAENKVSNLTCFFSIALLLVHMPRLP